MKKILSITLNIEKYIADPYRIELHKLIEIQKISGMMRARSEKKRRECLEAYLRNIGMTLDQYFELEKKAKEPFWKNEKGYIYIPINSFMACLANANDEAPARLRIDNLRSAIIATDFITEKKKPDGNFERFAVVKSGSGQTLSNQRGLRVNAYISNFKAKGELQFDLELVSPEAIKNLIEFAGRVIGIGGSRKLGWGRFTFTAT